MHISRFARHIVIMLVLLVTMACARQTVDIATPNVTQIPMTSQPPSGLLAAGVATGYIEALNRLDYARAYDLLNAKSQTQFKDANALRREYNSIYDTATTLTATHQINGGLLISGTKAQAEIVSNWMTGVFGRITVTGTLQLEVEKNAWRVNWTRDAILNGLISGTLSLDRDDPQRGNILSANGVALAGQGFVNQLGVQRGRIGDAQQENEMLAVISRITGLTTNDIRAKYANAPLDWFIPIAILPSETIAKNSQQLSKFAAISAQQYAIRTYADPPVAPHVVGYLGAITAENLNTYLLRGNVQDDLVGISGLEAALDNELAGRAGGTLELRPAQGQGRTRVIAKRAKIQGKDVTLSIDIALQLSAQNLISKTRGAIVVMNPREGTLLAMASGPSFSQNNILQNKNEAPKLLNDAQKPLINRTVQAYPPGSTFKIVTMAAGLNEGVTTANESFNDPGYWDLLGANYRLLCWRVGGHGILTMVEGLTASCNPVFYTLGKRLNDKNPFLLAQYSRQFGFGAKVGLDVGYESAGIVPDPNWKRATQGEVWVTGDNVNFSIGQGYMLATPLQIAQMTSVIANNGTLVRPRLVTKIIDPDTNELTAIKPMSSTKLTVAPDVVRNIQQGMIGVTTNTRIGTAENKFSSFDYYFVGNKIYAGNNVTVTKNLTSTNAIPILAASQRNEARKIIVAGKTGTAQAPGPRDLPFAWFTGYAPADNPQIVITVMLENVGEGSTFAAPLARKVIEAYFGLPSLP